MKATASILLVLALALLAGCNGDEDESADRTDAGDEAAGAPSFLFVAHADSGTTSRGSGDAYTLRIDGLGQSVVGFSDRPQRITENLSANDFFGAGWEQSFGDDPPNAALDIVEGGSADVSIFELENPRLSGSSVTFDAKLLSEPSGGLAHYGASDEPPARFGAVSLFIDSGDDDRSCSDARDLPRAPSGRPPSPPGEELPTRIEVDVSSTRNISCGSAVDVAFAAAEDEPDQPCRKRTFNTGRVAGDTWEISGSDQRCFFDGRGGDTFRSSFIAEFTTLLP